MPDTTAKCDLYQMSMFNANSLSLCVWQLLLEKTKKQPSYSCRQPIIRPQRLPLLDFDAIPTQKL